MAKHDFIPGVTDQGKPRAAPLGVGWPYPGHKTLGEQREAEEARRAAAKAKYDNERKSWRGYVRRARA